MRYLEESNVYRERVEGWRPQDVGSEELAFQGKDTEFQFRKVKNFWRWPVVMVAQEYESI